MTRDWNVASPWMGRAEVARRLGIWPIVAQLLYNRDITDPDEVAIFLNPQLSGLHPPEVIPNIRRAAQRIVDGVARKERILLYGDYDVDGITGIAILWHCLRLMGAQAEFYVPHRIEEGYGLSVGAIEQLADDGAELIVSVDCGITALEAAAAARRRGIDLIITDHHQIADALPEAYAVVHPSLEAEDSPNPDLSGAGVAFKLAWAMAQTFARADRVGPDFRDFLVDATSLAALGTVADVVPLRGENRILAHFGLKGLAGSSQVGIRALLASAGLLDSKLNTYDVGFKLAPRLNAAGRMGHAQLAVDLLTRADAERAVQIAGYLEQQNRRRQAVERRITEEAKQMVVAAEMHTSERRAIVLAAPQWHAGVIGIVASRLVDSFHRPAILIALDGDEGQGSGRSIDGYSLYEGLHHCRQYLTAYGGHDMAAGLKIHRDKVAAFSEQFIEHANDRIRPSQLAPGLQIDALVGLGDLSEPLVRQIQSLGPFGVGNPRPRLCTDWCDLAGEPRRVGRNGQHLQFAIRQPSTAQIIKAIAFGRGEVADDLAAKRRCQVAFQPIINEYLGRRSVELQIHDIRLP